MGQVQQLLFCVIIMFQVYTGSKKLSISGDRCHKHYLLAGSTKACQSWHRNWVGAQLGDGKGSGCSGKRQMLIRLNPKKSLLRARVAE
jgi:hypothetical protein